jgi:hypothetical protein
MAFTVETRSCPEIVRFYRELIADSAWNLGPLLALVEFIASSPYS